MDPRLVAWLPFPWQTPVPLEHAENQRLAEMLASRLRESEGGSREVGSSPREEASHER